VQLVLRVFPNRVPRKISGAKREGATRRWSNLRKEELNNLYFSPNNIGMIKSKRMA
jgi:hypothetical protein